jgi:hypothetical protein
MPRCGSGTCRGRGQITRPRPRLSRRRPRPSRPRLSRGRARPRPPRLSRRRRRLGRARLGRPRPGRPRRPCRTGLAKQSPSAARAPRPAAGRPPHLPRLRPRLHRPGQPGAGAAALQPRVPRARTRLGRGTEIPPAMRARAAPGGTRAAAGGRGIAHADASRADHRRFMITVPFQLSVTRAENVRDHEGGRLTDGQGASGSAGSTPVFS